MRRRHKVAAAVVLGALTVAPAAVVIQGHQPRTAVAGGFKGARP